MDKRKNTTVKSIGKNSFEKTVGDVLLTAYFFLLLTYMYYSRGEVIKTVVYVEKEYVFALIIAFSAFIYFLFTANYSRFVVSLKSAIVFSIPVFLMTMVSLYIWLVTRTDVGAIKRGLSGYYLYSNLFVSSLAMASLLYVFGEKAVWINFVALVMADMIFILQIWRVSGISVYMKELLTLIKTFSTEVGSVIIEAEKHELIFCIGAYVMYCLLYPPKGLLKWMAFAVGLFEFISGLKRIAVIAIALTLLITIPLKILAKKNEQLVKVIINVIMIIMIGILLAYVGVIKYGLFDYFEKIGLDTMGRSEAYRSLSEYYEFSPTFRGNGMGNLVYTMNTKIDLGIGAPHNDFVLYFSDMGFVGYIMWLVSVTFTRITYFGRNDNINGRINAFALTMYVLILSLTDNTFEYMLIMSVVCLLMTSMGYEQNVRSYEKSQFGIMS